MTPVLAASHYLAHPHIDWVSLSPLLALLGGALVVLMFGLLADRAAREQGVPVLTLFVFAITIALTIGRFNHERTIVAGALRVDDLALTLNLILCAGGIATVLFS